MGRPAILIIHAGIAEMTRYRAAMRIELNCRECGGNRFTLDRELDDLSVVQCEECGHRIGLLVELKEQVAQEVLARSSGTLRSRQ